MDPHSGASALSMVGLTSGEGVITDAALAVIQSLH